MSKRAGLLLAAVVSAALAGASPANAGEVADTAPPAGAVGGVTNPAAGLLRLQVLATDDGDGLASAQASLAGRAVSAPFDDPGAATGELTLEVDTTAVPDGAHQLLVTVTDAAGNVARLVDRQITVMNTLPPSNPSVTLVVGGGSAPPGGGPPAGGGGAGGGVAGEDASAPRGCRAPRLSMFLAQRPLRTRRGVVVLRKGQRYRFRGRLTCRVGTRRRAAPRNTPIEVLNRVGRRTIRKSGTTVRRKGRITVILAYYTRRTIVFRYRSPEGASSRVKVRIRVARRAPR